MVDPIPAGLEHRIIPYLMIDGASAAIDFYVEAFGAVEDGRLSMPDGTIGHAAITVNGAPVYLADAPAEMPGDAGNPQRLGGTSVLLHLYVTDVDAAGATVLRPAEDQFYGDRAAVLADPFGHQWSLHTRIREISAEEMAAAVAEMPAPT